MRSFTVKVRKDGAINLGKSNRTLMGIAPGSKIEVELKKGSFTCTPIGYTCGCCGKNVDTALTALGLCSACDSVATKAIRTKAMTIDSAIAHARAVNAPKKAVSK